MVEPLAAGEFDVQDADFDQPQDFPHGEAPQPQPRRPDLRPCRRGFTRRIR